MGRILAIDYGAKRTGVAVTDPLRIIATGLATVETKQLLDYLKKYIAAEAVDLVLVGLPTNWDDTATHATPLVQAFMHNFRKTFPTLPLHPVDERYTSKLASQAIAQMGLKKKQRQSKALVDEVAATILLQEYLQRHDLA